MCEGGDLNHFWVNLVFDVRCFVPDTSVGSQLVVLRFLRCIWVEIATAVAKT